MADKQTPYAIKLPWYFPAWPQDSALPAVTKERAQLGRLLFYDTILSANKALSCGSCHKQEYAFSDGPTRYSSGFGGKLQPRNTLPLFNLAWYPSYFWDGRAGSIEELVFSPVSAHDEMNLSWAAAEARLNINPNYRQQFRQWYGLERIDSIMVTKAIGAFLRTMISSNAKYDRVMRGEDHFTTDEFAGLRLVNDQTKADCLHCHTTDGSGLGTTLRFSNNGLDSFTIAANYPDKGLGRTTGNTSDNGKFKIPSIRNLVFTAPYMHDGRFRTLEEVLDFYSDSVHYCANIDSKMEFASRGGARLTPEEKRKVICFLKTMSDSSFVSNPAFGNPYKKIRQ